MNTFLLNWLIEKARPELIPLGYNPITLIISLRKDDLADMKFRKPILDKAIENGDMILLTPGKKYIIYEATKETIQLIKSIINL